MSASRATSYRIDPSIKARLEAQAVAEHTTERALLERLVAEGLDTLHHPGIVFRDGPTGRRAAPASRSNRRKKANNSFTTELFTTETLRHG